MGVMVTTKVNDPYVMVAFCRDSLLLYWKKPPTVDAVQQAIQAILSTYSQGKQKFHALVIAGAEVNSMPDAEARESLERGIKDLEPVYASTTIVIEHRGFIAASLRAMLTGVHLIVRPPYPFKVVAYRAEAQQTMEALGKGSEVRELLIAAR